MQHTDYMACAAPQGKETYNKTTNNHKKNAQLLDYRQKVSSCSAAFVPTRALT